MSFFKSFKKLFKSRKDTGQPFPIKQKSPLIQNNDDSDLATEEEWSEEEEEEEPIEEEDEDGEEFAEELPPCFGQLGFQLSDQGEKCNTCKVKARCDEEVMLRNIPQESEEERERRAVIDEQNYGYTSTRGI
jgi:hypothetical protein